MLISADGSAYDLKLNEQLSAKNYFVTNCSLNNSPRGMTSAGNIFFGTSEPATDLSANTYYNEGGEYVTTGINIPKEMKLFNVKLYFAPYFNSLPSPTIKSNYFRLYQDNTWVDEFHITNDNSYNLDRIEKNCLIYNPMSADSILSLRCIAKNADWNGWVTICINDETYRSIGTSVSGIPDNYDSLYSTVSSNSATWNEGGGSPDPCSLCRENFVEWNFTRSASQTRAAHPLFALSDTSGTPSGTLNAGDKYMLYLDGLLGQSAANNTFVNFGIQAGTTTGQYLLSGNGAPLPSKKLCRSTSTGNDFACSYMFTVPTNGAYSVAVSPTENNQEYKFFGNTTIRQIKIG